MYEKTLSADASMVATALPQFALSSVLLKYSTDSRI